MKINKDFEPLRAGISAAIVISILAFLTSETQIGIWLMFFSVQQSVLRLYYIT